MQACADAGIAAFTGDGLNEQVVKAAARAIGKAGGKGDLQIEAAGARVAVYDFSGEIEIRQEP